MSNDVVRRHPAEEPSLPSLLRQHGYPIDFIAARRIEQLERALRDISVGLDVTPRQQKIIRLALASRSYGVDHTEANEK